MATSVPLGVVPDMSSARHLASPILLAVSLVLLWRVWTDTGVDQLVAFAVMAFLLWIRWLPQLTHPLVWFVPPFAIYSLSFPALAVLGVHKYDEHMAGVVQYHGLALFAFALATIWGVRRQPRDFVMAAREWKAELVARSALLVLAPVAVLLLALVYRSGATTKRELIDAGGMVSSMAQFTLWLVVLTSTVCIIVRVWKKQRIGFVVLLTGFICTLALVVMGERDYLLRFVLFGVLIAWDRKRQPTMTMAIVVGAIAFASLPALQAMKAIALGNPFNYAFDFYTLFDQEFRSMGKNTWVILSDGGYRSITGTEVLDTEISRIFASDLLGIEGQSMTSWFNETFFGNPGAGKGFSLVASGYLLGGAVGVFAVYFLLGRVMSWLYMCRYRSVYALTLYVLAVPEFIYSQRADVSNFVGPMLKSIGLPLLILAFATEVLIVLRSRDAAYTLALPELAKSEV